MKTVYPAEKDRGHGTKGGARALLLKGCCVKFPGVSVPQVSDVEVVCSHAVYEDWNGTTVAAGTAGTLDGGVLGLVKRGATDIPVHELRDRAV